MRRSGRGRETVTDNVRRVWEIEGLVACPTCDALNMSVTLGIGSRGRCHRCHAILSAPRNRALTQIVMLSVTALVLLMVAVFMPFLELSAAGMVRRSSILDAALTFSEGITLPLTLAVTAFTIVLPALRLSLLLYVTAPMALGWRAARHAIWAFRLSENLRPWAMAEVFMIGVAVALVKVSGLASLHIGVAFWALVGLVLATIISDSLMCRLTIWRTLEQRSRH